MLKERERDILRERERERGIFKETYLKRDLLREKRHTERHT